MGLGNTQDLEKRLYVANGELGKDQDGNPFNYVDGALAGIYFYADPGNKEKQVQPCTKLCIELIDRDEDGKESHYTVVGRYDGSGGAASWFATTVADGLQSVPVGAWCRISVKAASKNDKVTFAKVDVESAGGSWQRQRSEVNYSTIEPVARGEMTHALIINHPAYHDGTERAQEPQVEAEADESVAENYVGGMDARVVEDEAHMEKDPRGAPRGAKGGFFAIAKSIGVPVGDTESDKKGRHDHYSKVLGRPVNSGKDLSDMDWQILFEDAKKRQENGEEEDPNYNPHATSPHPVPDPDPFGDTPTPASPERPAVDIAKGLYDTAVEAAKKIGIDVTNQDHRNRWAGLAGLVKKDIGGHEFFIELEWVQTGRYESIKYPDSITALADFITRRTAELAAQAKGVGAL